jgi:hypothetical protein
MEWKKVSGMTMWSPSPKRTLKIKGSRKRKAGKIKRVSVRKMASSFALGTMRIRIKFPKLRKNIYGR